MAHITVGSMTKMRKSSAPYKTKCRKLKKKNCELVAENKDLKSRIAKLNEFNRSDIIDVEE